MSTIATEGFAVIVGRPGSYSGPAELRVGQDSVILVARPVRHYRAIVASFYALCAPLVLIGGVFNWAGGLALEEPGLSGAARSQALLMAYGGPVIGGVLVAVLVVGGIRLLFPALRGDPRSMTAPLKSVSLVRHRARGSGRVLVLRAAFDSTARPRNWTLVAGSRDDAETIAATLMGGGEGLTMAST